MWDVVCRVFEICVMLTCVYARLGTIAAIHQSLNQRRFEYVLYGFHVSMQS